MICLFLKKLVVGVAIVGVCGIMLSISASHKNTNRASANNFISKEIKELEKPEMEKPESYNRTNNEEVTVPEVIAPPKTRSVLGEATTKEELTTRMLNSIDHFSNAKGQLVYTSSNDQTSYTTDFVMNSYNINLSYEATNFTVKPELSRSKKSSGVETKFVQTFDSKNLNLYNLIDDEVSERTDQVLDVPPIQTRGDFSAEGEGLAEKISIDEDGIPTYELKADPTHLVYAKQALLPEDLTLGILKDIENWEIVSDEEVAGVSTKRIEGQLNEEYRKRYLSETFIMNVDPKTGILLRFESYLGKELKEQMLVNHLELNSILNKEMFETTKEEVANEK